MYEEWKSRGAAGAHDKNKKEEAERKDGVIALLAGVLEGRVCSVCGRAYSGSCYQYCDVKAALLAAQAELGRTAGRIGGEEWTQMP